MQVVEIRRKGVREGGGGWSGVFHFVHCQGTQFRSLLWLLFFRWPTASPAVYTRQTVAAVTPVHRYVIAFRSDATSGAIYCLTAPFLPQHPPPVFIYCRGTIDGSLFLHRDSVAWTITIASDNERNGPVVFAPLSLHSFLPLFAADRINHRRVEIGFDRGTLEVFGPIFEDDLSPRIGTTRA